MSLRGRAATMLRGLAQAIDGREFMDAKWHKASVRSMNSYIERTEQQLLCEHEWEEQPGGLFKCKKCPFKKTYAETVLIEELYTRRGVQIP